VRICLWGPAGAIPAGYPACHFREELRDERNRRLADLRDLDRQLALPALHVPRAESVALPRARLGVALIASTTQPGIELLLDSRWMINRAPSRASSPSITCGSSTIPRPSSLSISACICADGGTVRLTA
jgi:hypothetical protein